MTTRIFIAFISAMAAVVAQDLPPRQLEPATLAEELFAQQELDLNYEELYETVLQYLASPIDLNKADGAELRSLFLLSDRQISDFLEHRRANGNLISIYELQSIDSFDPELIRRLEPFVTLGTAHTKGTLIQRILNEHNNYLLLRYHRLLEPSVGFQATQDSIHRFTGTPDKYFARFRVSHPREFSMGFTVEKDPGESRVADFYSFHLQRCGRNRLINLIVGDFQAFFGQGLVLGGGFGMGKGGETILTMRRNTLGFIPWTSSAENGFFRGVGTTIALSKHIVIHGMLSRKAQDGNVRSDTSSADPIASLLTSGLHRNALENARRKVLSEDNTALVLEYRNGSLQIGLASLRTSWGAALTQKATVYNRQEPMGMVCTNAGAFVNYTVRNFNFFGEAAQTLGWGKGAVAGALVSASRNLDLALIGRHYTPDFWSPYGSAVSENSVARNESAVYWGWRVQLSRKIGLAGYLDLFHFPWMQYRLHTPSSSGHDALFRMTWKPRKEVSFILQAREERKARNTTQQMPTYVTTTGIKRNYSAALNFSHGPLVLKTRVQGSTLKLASRTGGMAIVQDIGLERRHWSLYLRQALFDTDDFENRQYTYEPDMWLAYSFPAYYGSGVRTTAMIRFRVGRHADLWLRWAQTRFEDRNSTGSGLDAVEGPMRNDLKAQLRLKL